MVNSLINISPLKSAISWISSSKQRQIFAISSVAFLISLPFLRPLAKKICPYIWTDKSPPFPKSPTGQPISQVSKRRPVSSKSFAPYQVYLTTVNRGTITIDVQDPNESLLNFTSRVSSQATKDNDSLKDISYYDDVKIIITGKVWNTTELEYVSVHELFQEYKIQLLATIHLVFWPKEDAQVKALADQLLSQKNEISQIFDGLDWHGQSRLILQHFRTSLHSCCDRIFRSKVDAASASSETLQRLQKVLIQIVENASDPQIKSYFNGLLASVSNVYARFQDSFKALWEAVENRIRLIPEPDKPTTTPNGILIGNQTFQFSLDDTAKHSTYFDSMKDFGSILKEGSQSWNFNDKPDEVQNIDLSYAMQYLIGNDIKQTVKDRPLPLSRAALYLGIPRLVLMCEVELIKGVEQGHLKKDHFKEISQERIRLEMPHLYKAFDMKGWLSQNQI